MLVSEAVPQYYMNYQTLHFVLVYQDMIDMIAVFYLENHA